MENRYSRQLKRGVLEIIVLKMISMGQTYGYELISRLDRESGGLFLLKEGTLYPILYRLEEEGLIESRWSTPEGRNISKKYYEITQKGTDTLPQLLSLWNEFSGCVSRLLSAEEETL